MIEKWCYSVRGLRRKSLAQEKEGFREELASDTVNESADKANNNQARGITVLIWNL